MRSMSEILANSGPSVPAKAEAPETAREDDAQRDVAEVETEQAKDAEPKSEPAKEPKAAEQKAEEQDAEDAIVPDDLAGLKRALAAARGDKRKARKAWRDTELQLSELKGRLEAAQHSPVVHQEPAQKPAPKEPPKAPVLDEDAFYSQGPTAVQTYLDARLASERDAWAKQTEQQRFLDRSEARAEAKHQDYKAKLELFQQSASPQVIQQMLADEDPAEFVYEWASAYDVIKDTPSIEALRAKIRQEVLAEQSAGQAAEQPAAVARPKPQPQRSIAGARGTGAHVKAQWAGPRPMTEILGSR